MKDPHHNRRLRRRVLEVVGQQSAQRRSAATHVPALTHHTLAANLLQTPDILTPLHPRRLSRILGERGRREEKRTGQSNNQSNGKHWFMPVHQCFPFRLVCVIVPTVELILTFRFSSTLMFELTALMLISELSFCCAPPFNVSVLWFWVVPATGPVITPSVRAPVAGPFLACT